MLNPGSIAIVGASSDTNKLNGRPLHYLSRDGYGGALYPVNPKYQQIRGVTCYADVAELPVAPDLAIVAVAARGAADAVAALGRRGVPVAMVFSAGYGELGAEGARLERDLIAAAGSNGIRLCGPNTLGLINAFEHVTATFSQYAGETPAPGPVAFVSQSGALGTGIAALARSRHMGLGYFVNTGNEADIDLTEVLQAIADDPRVRVLSAYIEGVSDGPGLVLLARRAMGAGKPFVVTKVGRKAAGARAAASHTGSLAGEDRVFDGVAHQHGMIRARNEEHLVDLMSAFTCCPIPSGPGVAVITQSGGAGVLMADRAEELRLQVPVLSEDTCTKLNSVLPTFAVSANPIDITAQFLAEPRMLHDSVRIVLEDPAVHLCIVWLQLMDRYTDVLVDVFRDLRACVDKPFLVCWLQAPSSALKQLSDAGVCVIPATERAVDAAAGLIEYGEARKRLAGRPLRLPDRVTATGTPRTLSTAASASLLRAAGLPLVPSEAAESPAAARAAAGRLGYPVAVKVESPDLAHKSDVGGVCLGLGDGDAVAAATDQVMRAARTHAPNARIQGVVVQAMCEQATELVLGVRRDPVFGPVVMVGVGGIFVEILDDVVFATAPVSHADAAAMLDRLQARDVLDGARGRPAADRDAVLQVIQDLSRFAATHPEVLELDLNPVFASAQGVVIVDWLVVVDGD
jgi:acetyltransferase